MAVRMPPNYIDDIRWIFELDPNITLDDVFPLGVPPRTQRERLKEAAEEYDSLYFVILDSPRKRRRNVEFIRRIDLNDLPQQYSYVYDNYLNNPKKSWVDLVRDEEAREEFYQLLKDTTVGEWWKKDGNNLVEMGDEEKEEMVNNAYQNLLSKHLYVITPRKVRKVSGAVKGTYRNGEEEVEEGEGEEGEGEGEEEAEEEQIEEGQNNVEEQEAEAEGDLHMDIDEYLSKIREKIEKVKISDTYKMALANLYNHLVDVVRNNGEEANTLKERLEGVLREWTNRYVEIELNANHPEEIKEKLRNLKNQLNEGAPDLIAYKIMDTVDGYRRLGDATAGVTFGMPAFIAPGIVAAFGMASLIPIIGFAALGAYYAIKAISGKGITEYLRIGPYGEKTDLKESIKIASDMYHALEAYA